CKRAVFDLWRELAKSAGAKVAWTRVFWLYGPGERPVRLVPAVAHALLRGEEARVSSGEQVRDFLHVADVASGVVHVALRDDLEGAFNVASGEPVRVRDVVAAIARIIGREDLIRYGAFPTRPGEPPAVFADVSKLRSTGWAPRFGLESGLEDAV